MFEPLGVIQGWSQKSMAYAARSLAKMGYRYLALGGMVPLGVSEIHAALRAIHAELADYPDIRLHILGFAKADNLDEFATPGVYPKLASIDTTSPLLRAFKDAQKNYYLPASGGKLNYYVAIRVPQAAENNTLKKAIKKGIYPIEMLVELEQCALTSLRAYDKGLLSLTSTLDAVMSYAKTLIVENYKATSANEIKLSKLAFQYKETLIAQPWKYCSCPICSALSIEVIIFRGSNRNKRRGIHNLHIFHEHLKNLR
jgi:hypothetical protein